MGQRPELEGRLSVTIPPNDPAAVLTPSTCSLYRNELPGCFVVHLMSSRPEALRRAGNRRVWLTHAEFHLLHDADVQHPPLADATLVVDGLTVEQQTAAAESLWASAFRSGC